MSRLSVAAFAAALAVCFVGFHLPAGAAEPPIPSPQEKYDAAVAKIRGNWESTAKSKLDAAKDELKKTKSKDRIAELKKEIKTLEQRIKDAKTRPIMSSHLQFYGAPAVGGVGLPLSIEIRQIIGEDKMLVDFEFHEPPFSAGRTAKQLVMLRGVSTAGHVDGGAIKPVCLFEIVGTEKYGTAIGGTKTVFVAEPIVVELPK